MKPMDVMFGCAQGYLDPFTLQNKWFGAVWCYRDNLQMVMGYWFADSQTDLLNNVRKAGWTHWIDDASSIKLKKVYDSIRMEQEKLDWQRRSCLRLSAAFRKPWKHVKPGWYVLRSNRDFPTHVSAIQKKRYTVWLVHVAVCENEKDLFRFIERVQRQHSIKLYSEPSLIFSNVWRR
ncbi:hypothetical protein O9H85_14190 [Paenibacillus filicis]|uniref:Uncharacterized protein n=1 Tax=Paenibacillus gyeongsangnamensis TaxID=3388067 RepID=A0ABT4Q9L2_9BACL|nr:hypothetical protein [Paenibacillus filicis]MCZ8513563.1 hypothetical protein [Paenibacillus filicis]